MARVERVAFLGTGIMGSRIAANPAASGRARRVEPTRKRAEDVADAHGARVAATPAEGATEAGAVVTMVSTLLRSRSAAARGGFLDAPVSGPKPKAGDTTLTIMVGAEPDAYERALPLFEAMGELVVHVGPPRHGQVVRCSTARSPRSTPPPGARP